MGYPNKKAAPKTGGLCHFNGGLDRKAVLRHPKRMVRVIFAISMFAVSFPLAAAMPWLAAVTILLGLFLLL